VVDIPSVKLETPQRTLHRDTNERTGESRTSMLIYHLLSGSISLSARTIFKFRMERLEAAAVGAKIDRSLIHSHRDILMSLDAIHAKLHDPILLYRRVS